MKWKYRSPVDASLDTTLSRRDLVFRSVVSVAGFAALSRSGLCLASEPLSPGRYLAAGAREGGPLAPESLRHFLTLFNVTSKVVTIVPVKFDVHSVLQNPKTLATLAISKEHSQATFFPDLKYPDRQIPVNAHGENIFSGHGVFSPDSLILVTSETSRDTKSGDIVLRDSVSLKEIARYPSGGIYPHEMHFADEGRTLVIANGGFEFKGSNLSFLDIKSGKVIETRKPPIEGPGIRHFVREKSGKVFIGTWSRYGVDESKLVPIAEVFASGSDANGSLQVVSPPDELKKRYAMQPSQFLSVFLHEPSAKVVMTATSANVVVVIDTKTSKILAALPKDNPTGCTLGSDTDHVVVSDAAGFLQSLNMKTLKWNDALAHQETNLKGSHLSMVRI